jgi:hypothetical protein
MNQKTEAERFAHFLDVEIWITPKESVYLCSTRTTFGVAQIPTSITIATIEDY